MQYRFTLLGKWLKRVALIVIFVSLFASCEKENVYSKEHAYRAIAWNYLSADLKSVVIHDWKKANVTWRQYQGQEVAAVDFYTNNPNSAVLGPVTVMISVKNRKPLGIAPRF